MSNSLTPKKAHALHDCTKQSNLLTIGITSANGIPSLSFSERMSLIKAAGFGSVLLWWGGILLERVSKKERVSGVRDNGLIIENAHSDMKNINSIWADGYEGEEKTDELLRSVYECAEFDIKRMVVHLTSGFKPPAASAAGFFRIEKIVRAASDSNVVICFENLRVSDHLVKTMSLYESCDNVAFCFDSGHANIWCRDTDWAGLYSNRISAIHLHDNLGVDDDHLIPFCGCVNWQKIARILFSSSYSGTLTLESEYRAIAYGDDEDSDRSAFREYLSKAYSAGCTLKDMILGCSASL